MKKHIGTGMGFIALAGAFLAAAAWAHTTGVFATPTAVAVVDFDSLQFDLAEQKKIGEDLALKFQPIIDKIEAMNEEYQTLVNKLETEIGTMTEDEKRDLSIEGMYLEQKIQSLDNIRKQSVQVEIYKAMQDYYPKIYAAVEHIAERDGWDIVLLDTSIVDRSLALDLNQLNDAISRRHVLFVSKDVDITEDVRQYLNDEFANAQAAPEKLDP